MAKTLGGISLPDQLEWSDRYDWDPVAQDVRRTLGGGQVLFAQSLHAGRPVTLIARDRVAWLPSATLAALRGLAAIPGGTHTLEWDGEMHSVAFRHHEPPAIAVEAVFPHGDQYFGTLKLITM